MTGKSDRIETTFDISRRNVLKLAATGVLAGVAGQFLSAPAISAPLLQAGTSSKSMFDPIALGGLSVKNRLIRSASLEFSTDEQGGFSHVHTRVYSELAKGGVGTIITGMVGVSGNSCAFPAMVRSDSESFVAGLRALAKIVHAYDCKLIVQLVHCGMWATVLEDGKPPMGPCGVDLPSGVRARAMTADDIAALAEYFAQAAFRCKEAGADGVQIHAAHGFLLTQFLAPYFNKRQDAYGGDIAGRGRIVLEVYDAIRNKVGTDYSVWLKMNSRDIPEQSISPAECLWICKELEGRGIDAIELSGGLGQIEETSVSPRIRKESDEGTFVAAALELAGQISVPVISVGGHRTPDRIEDWLNRGNIAAFALSRPFIREPALTNRWKRGARGKATCISCSLCVQPKGEFGCQVG